MMSYVRTDSKRRSLKHYCSKEKDGLSVPRGQMSEGWVDAFQFVYATSQQNINLKYPIGYIFLKIIEDFMAAAVKLNFISKYCTKKMSKSVQTPNKTAVYHLLTQKLIMHHSLLYPTWIFFLLPQHVHFSIFNSFSLNIFYPKIQSQVCSQVELPWPCPLYSPYLKHVQFLKTPRHPKWSGVLRCKEISPLYQEMWVFFC